MMETANVTPSSREFQMTIDHTFIGDRAHIALPLMLTFLVVGVATIMALSGN